MGFQPQYIKQAREDIGLSITQAARIAGISKSSWWEIENGRTDPRASTIDAMARAVGHLPGSFFCYNAEPFLSETERRVLAALRISVQTEGDG